MFLTKDELEKLTGRKRSDAQLLALKHMGLAHRVRADGTVAVLKAHVEQEMGMVFTKKAKREEQPDFGALHA